jgi:hypothetical protein
MVRTLLALTSEYLGNRTRGRSVWPRRKQSRQKAIKGDLPTQALQVRPFHLRPRLQSGF